jgi:hypothetical protein
MSRAKSLFDGNTRKSRIAILVLAGVLIVAVAFIHGRLAVALSVTSFIVLMVLFLLSRVKSDGAIQSASTCFCMAMGTIMYWKEHAGVVPILVGGGLAAGFGIIATKHFCSQTPGDAGAGSE